MARMHPQSNQRVFFAFWLSITFVFKRQAKPIVFGLKKKGTVAVILEIKNNKIGKEKRPHSAVD